MFMFARVSLALLGVFSLMTPNLVAQDTRTVTEPHLPPACVTLKANLVAPGGVLAAEDETRLDTARIQSAIDGCAAGKGVYLRASGVKDVFLSGPLTLRSGVTLVVEAHAALVGSRDPRVYDLTPGSCGIVSKKGHGCKPLLLGDGVENSGIMGEGSIDGRGGATLLGQKVTWWDLAHEAKVTDRNQSVPWMIILHHAKNFTLYGITLRNSPGFHVAVNETDGFTAWGVKIMTPKTARNTDGIDPGSSRNVTITHCFIHAGDDNVAVKSSVVGPAENISILHNHFYTGHGMSIGSGTNGGVDHILVEDLTIDGADNGIRIKSDRSRGGLVHDVVYRDVCIRDTKNPLFFTPLYTRLGGDLIPEYRDITLRDVHILTAGTYTLLGADAEHKLQLTLDNVFAEDLAHSRMTSKDAAITVGPRKGNLTPADEDVTVTETPGAQAGRPLNCDGRFVPFPATDTAPEMAGSAPPVDKALYVAKDGTAEYTTIQSAVDAAPEGGAEIIVAPGTYREVLTITKPHITLRSAHTDASETVVVNDRSAGANGGTLHSATVNVIADDFFAENITLQNDFNRTHPQLPKGSQALALLVRGDRAEFHNVRLLGNQDTVFAGSRDCKDGDTACTPARQYFSDCYIEGNVDFIFGDGKAVFDHCEIHSTPHHGGYITAQSKHFPAEDSGFVLNRCTLTGDKAETGDVFLGRPWRPYATVVVLHTEMGAQIDPAGWSEWHMGETHSLDTSYYAEFDSTGPGADPAKRDPHTKFLTAEEAKQYAPAEFLRGADNWTPARLRAEAK
jgi:polygalacturonase